MIKDGYCQCGCGQQTKLAPKTRNECGWVKGQPLKFINGHNGRSEICAAKLCECGCGEYTKIATYTASYKGIFKGKPLRFIIGHQNIKWENHKPCKCGCGQLTYNLYATLKCTRSARSKRGPYKIKIIDDTKYCNKCCKFVSLKYFWKTTKSADGYTFWCSNCLSTASKNWKLNNPDMAKIIDHRKRAKRLGAKGFFTYTQLIARLEYYSYKCAYCGGPYECIDHVIPIAKGGTNWPANLRPSCNSCNLKKLAKSPKIWFETLEKYT